MSGLEFRNLVWIDDDVRTLGTPQQKLKQAGFNLEVFDGVDSAWAYLEDAAPSERYGIIIDIMMATGKILEYSNTEGGVKTGEAFLRKIKIERPEWFTRHKFIIYTITDHPSTKGFSIENEIPFFSKLDFAGESFAPTIKAVFVHSADAK